MASKAQKRRHRKARNVARMREARIRALDQASCLHRWFKSFGREWHLLVKVAEATTVEFRLCMKCKLVEERPIARVPDPLPGSAVIEADEGARIMRDRMTIDSGKLDTFVALGEMIDAEVQAASTLHRAFVENMPEMELLFVGEDTERKFGEQLLREQQGEASLPDGEYIPPKGIEPGLSREEIEAQLTKNRTPEHEYRREVLGTFTVELTQEMIDRATAKPEAFVDFAQRALDG